MGNLVTKRFLIDGSWTAPAGVSRVKVKSYQVLSNPVSVGRTGLGITAYGDCYSWGANNNGEMGDGTVAGKSVPVLVFGQLRFRQVSQSNVMSAGVTEDGLLYCWGGNTVGQLGDGTQVSKSTPTLVSGGKRWKQVSVGRTGSDNFCLGLTVDGDAFAWGGNTFGSLGVGDQLDRSSPTLVVGSLKFQKLGAGFENAGGLAVDGKIYCWGDNQFGQAGNGVSGTTYSSPVLVTGGLTFKEISVGSSTVAGITTGDVLYMWGFGNYGQTGHGNQLNNSSPVVVLGGQSWYKVSASNGGLTGMTVGINNSGVMYAWGFNGQGQLGDGTVLDRSSPVLVSGGKTWLNAFAGGLAVVGIDELGIVYAWGFNGTGQLGNADNLSRSSPVLVFGSKPWRSMRNALINEEVVDVTPGTAYSISVTGTVVQFGTKTFLQASYGRCMVVLEYFM